MGDINIEGDVVVEVKEDLEKKLYHSGNLVMPSHCSILRIPTILSRHSIDRKAYLPNAFSIGPFHHNEERLKPTEKIKHKYLLDLISRLSDQNYTQNPKDPDTILSTLTEAIHKVSKEAREYYAGPIGMEAKEFEQVLLLDGCFIIELFRKKANENFPKDQSDPIFSMSCMLQFLYHDVILLENQIPWMVLDTLFSLTTTSIDEKSLVELALDSFCNVFSTKPPPKDFLLSHPHKHILDLLRNSLVLTSSKRGENTFFDGKLEHMRSATSLDNSGIKFKKEDTSQSILDIQFDEITGELKIPPLLIQETTETVFRNLISLEQCCPHYEPIVTSYAVLLDNLINTKDDIELLCKKEAITTWLNVEEATKAFSNLYLDTYLKESFYSKLTRDVDKYCRISWHGHLKALKRDYFKNPWAFISFIAATILLILTFLQTLFAIKT